MYKLLRKFEKIAFNISKKSDGYESEKLTGREELSLRRKNYYRTYAAAILHTNLFLDLNVYMQFFSESNFHTA